MNDSIKYSKEAMDILGKVPSPIVRYGLLAFSLILSIIIICMTMIKYPDTVQIPVKMSPHFPGIFFSEITEGNLNNLGIGQKVSISLKEYPPKNYGTWEGTIKSISIPFDAVFYKVKIEISPCSVSTKGYEFPFVARTVWGTAEYNGDDKSFFQRIFSDYW